MPRKREKSKLPCRIWSYGAKPSIENTRLVEDQMLLAHRYGNTLVKLERDRRKKVEEALPKFSPELVKVQADIKENEEKREKAREEIRAASARQRKKVRPPEFMQAVREAKGALKELYEKRKNLRAVVFESEAWKAEQEQIEIWNKEQQHRLRAECGLYWGTYLQVEQSIPRKGAPPQFKSWDGDGHLAVQIQKGMTIEELFSMKDQRLRIEPVPAAAWVPGGRHLRKTKAHMRVSSTKEGDPIWAVIPIVLHRMPPKDAVVKWAHFIRRRIATNYEWKFQLVMERAGGWDPMDRAAEGTIGIDIGWRLRNMDKRPAKEFYAEVLNGLQKRRKSDGSLRVAYWADSYGNEGELLLPADWLKEMRRTESIRSHRDKNFNNIRDRLLAEVFPGKVPEWLTEPLKTLPQWRSIARLASLVLKWRENRFPGDEAIFNEMEAWRKRDKHLYDFEGNLRDQLQNRRQDLYRCFAATIRRKYKTAMIEDLDLREFHWLPNAEEDSPIQAVREHIRDACISVLIRCIKESMAEVIKLPAPYTTQNHYPCGSIEKWDHKELMHRCSKCGELFDQDANAAVNLLHGYIADSGTIKKT